MSKHKWLIIQCLLFVLSFGVLSMVIVLAPNQSILYIIVAFVTGAMFALAVTLLQDFKDVDTWEEDDFKKVEKKEHEVIGW